MAQPMEKALPREPGAHLAARPAGFIVGPGYDFSFFVLPPLMAVALGLSAPWWSGSQVTLFGNQVSWWAIAFALILSGGDIGFFRAYLNQSLFQRFWFQLTIVPGVVLLLVSLSNAVFLAAL